MRSKSNITKKLLGIIFSLFIIVWLVDSYREHNTAQLTNTIKNTHTTKTLIAHAANVSTPALPVTDKQQKEEADAIDFGNPNLQERIQTVASQYQQQSQFPSTSMPIRDEASLEKYIPNRTAGASMPLIGSDGKPDGVVTLKTDKYQYFHGEIITITGTVSGKNHQAQAQFLTTIQSKGRTFYKTPLKRVSDNTFSASIDTSALDTTSWPSELQIQADIVLDGTARKVVDNFRIDSPIAELTGIAASYIEQEYLIIPTRIATQATGYYRVTGNLYSATSNKPLIHLEGKEKIRTSPGILQLKAHIKSLELKQDEGPYILKDIWIERMPSAPDFRRESGISSQAAFEIQHHYFDEYENKAYEDDRSNSSAVFFESISRSRG